MKLNSAAVLRRAVMSALLVMATGVVHVQPAAAQFVCGGSADGSGAMTGASATATGANATACGPNANAGNIQSAAYGSNASATGFQGSAFGPLSEASATGSTASGANATASGLFGVATGYSSTASGTLSAATGSFAGASGAQSVAVGASTRANATNSVAIGGNSSSGAGGAAFVDAGATNGIAIGAQSQVGAAGVNAMAVGVGANAGFAGSTAIGNGAATTRVNQVAVGTAGNTYTMAGIASASSRAAQSGPTQIVTSDSGGNLSTTTLADLGLAGPSEIATINSRLAGLDRSVNDLYSRTSRANAGVAMAFAMAGVPSLSPTETLAATLNYGTFEGATGVAINTAYRLSQQLHFNAGIAYTPDAGIAGGRVGLRLGW